ncbi:YfbM family protein [Streptomyces sp. LS1784]|uniref:YfbM family protein n=1 Tax=Streptomyces sp. LS1784 TaxID=2851533 RepID=UPI001CCD2687|nr:YfbM family protein [Streptomyces sp. LS1784]
MSIVTQYLRLNQRELERAAREPDWISAFADEVAEQESERPVSPSERRTHNTGKAWDALRFLFERRAFPVDLAHGGEELPGADDWGYGPPRVLTPEQVRLAADALADLPFPALLGDTTAADLVRADVYPTGLWEDDPDLPYLQAHHAALTAFVRTTARYRHGLLVWSA